MTRFATYTFLFFILAATTKAQSPGMWLPNDIDSIAWVNMKATGFELTQKDLYDEKNSSLKDAIVLFGGGCTAEFISAEGLLLTNHHCGLGAVQALSSIENDYLQNGFWAKNKSEEKPCPAITVTRIVSIKDVSNDINKLLSSTLTETQRQRKIDSASQRIAQDATMDTKYGAYVRPFYNGNEFVLFVTETFNDVRLVGVPPISIGNFGGDTDNWVWPRHTGDFTLFRVYANSTNTPEDYNATNVPYKPLKFLTVSMRGVNENDFTMVYGFPGRTTQYLPSSAVDMIQNVTDPIRVEVRTARLNAWEQAMKSNDTVRIQYQAKYNGVANGWKKWQGEIKGLKETNAIAWKQEQEKEFTKRAVAKNKYTNVLPQLNATYDSMKTVLTYATYQSEALEATELFDLVESLAPVVAALKDKNKKLNVDSLSKEVYNNLQSFYKNYSVTADRAAYNDVMKIYAMKVPQQHQPNLVGLWLLTKGPDFMVDNLYAKSMLDNKTQMLAWAKSLKRGSEKKIEKDPIYMLWQNTDTYYQTILSPTVARLSARANLLNRDYMKAQMELVPERLYFPDANSTLRVTYGKVVGYQPIDGTRYRYYTTSDGILEKNATVAADDYVLRDDYKNLLTSKIFGAYAASDGTLHTDFIATNHTTGGNSGSPVLNSKGEFIGINFDRVWEGTMSDVRFMPDRCRNIAVDARYILFVIDKYGGAGYLLNEMDIKK